MTFLDRWLQQQRIKKAIPFIPENSVVLDIGCHNGELLNYIEKKIQSGFGIDPLLNKNSTADSITLIRGNFPADWNEKQKMNCITALAVLEHLPATILNPFAEKCFESLQKNGVLILTVPAKKTDTLLALLKKLRLIKGMSLEEHHGYDPANTKNIFESAGFVLITHKPFQAGFNNLFVFRKTD
jgi:2-polyprenyl-3-methyl-5-hydroxy-6-metoxy-1,4-benzoquinol methylase